MQCFILAISTFFKNSVAMQCSNGWPLIHTLKYLRFRKLQWIWQDICCFKLPMTPLAHILNLSDTELMKCLTNKVLNLWDTEVIRYQTYQKPNLSDKELTIYCLPDNELATGCTRKSWRSGALGRVGSHRELEWGEGTGVHLSGPQFCHRAC
jgi:hypothetical protein